MSNQRSQKRSNVNQQTSEEDYEEIDDENIQKVYASKLTPLLNEFDKIRPMNLQISSDIPSIAVIGDQSVGKSSVLEQVSGIALPRGTKLVTRCPLQLEMRNVSHISEPQLNIIYEPSSGDPVNKEIKISEIDEAIRKAQIELTGNEFMISDSLIRLNVQSKNHPDLTLIDLPGIARFVQDPEKNSQIDVHTITTDLIRNYIKKKNTICMIVCPVNTDIQTVEALSLVQEFDPDFDRSFAILTFPDVINSGKEKDIIQLINGNGSVQLQKGFLIIKCRSQDDINNGLSLSESIESEREFFEHNYNGLKPHQYGTNRLIEKLVKELFGMISSNLHELRASMKPIIRDIEIRLNSLTSSMPETPTEQIKVIYKSIDNFAEDLEKNCKGDDQNVVETKQLYKEFRKFAADFSQQVYQVCDLTNNKDLFVRLLNEVLLHRQRELPNLLDTYRVMEKIVKPDCVKPISDLAFSLMNELDDKVKSVVLDSLTQQLHDYPKLEKLLIDFVNEVRENMKQLCSQRIEDVISCESVLFTQDRIYGMVALRSADTDQIAEDQAKNNAENASAANDVINSKIVRYSKKLKDKWSKVDITDEELKKKINQWNEENNKELLKSMFIYLKILAQRISDSIPLWVREFLLFRFSHFIKKEAYITLIDQNNPQQYLEKSDDQQKEIDTLKNNLLILKSADEKFNKLIN